MIGANVFPNELNACTRFNRLEEVSGVPKTATKGFAAICKKVKPAPNKVSENKKNIKVGFSELASKKIKKQEMADMIKPNKIVFLYPIFSIGSPNVADITK
jgi:hypothetical protein